MRILILIFFVLAVVWYLRRGQSGRQPRSSESQTNNPRQSDPHATPPPEAMLRCAQCGLHLPAADALPGKGGHFCGAEHRAAYEHEHRHENATGT